MKEDNKAPVSPQREKEIFKKAIFRHSNPYGKANPETAAFIEGYKLAMEEYASQKVEAPAPSNWKEAFLKMWHEAYNKGLGQHEAGKVMEWIEENLLTSTSKYKWEIFLDESYYQWWAVRPVGDKDFRSQRLFHVASKQEAESLKKLLEENYPAPSTEKEDKGDGLYDFAKFMNHWQSENEQWMDGELKNIVKDYLASNSKVASPVAPLGSSSSNSIEQDEDITSGMQYCNWCKTKTMQVAEDTGMRCQKCLNQNPYFNCSSQDFTEYMVDMIKRHGWQSVGDINSYFNKKREALRKQIEGLKK